MREKETAAERCEVAIQDDIDNTKCRIVVKMICKHGTLDHDDMTSMAVAHPLARSD